MPGHQIESDYLPISIKSENVFLCFSNYEKAQ